MDVQSHLCAPHRDPPPLPPGTDPPPPQGGVTEPVALAAAGLYLVLSVAALTQLVRVQLRVPTFGWTTQKAFFAGNLCAGLSRAAQFGRLGPAAAWPLGADAALSALPALAVASAWTGHVVVAATVLMVPLFWADIRRAAAGQSSSPPRAAYVWGVASLVALALVVWGIAARAEVSSSSSNAPDTPDPPPGAPDALGGASTSTETAPGDGPASPLADPSVARLRAAAASDAALALVWTVCCGAYIHHGGRLWTLLRRFPAEARGRRGKLREVGGVAAISSLALGLRAALRGAGAAAGAAAVSAASATPSAFDLPAWAERLPRLDLPGGASLSIDVAAYLSLELVPMLVGLGLLRRLPPRPPAPAGREPAAAEAHGSGGGGRGGAWARPAAWIQRASEMGPWRRLRRGGRAGTGWKSLSCPRRRQRLPPRPMLGRRPLRAEGTRRQGRQWTTAPRPRRLRARTRPR